MAEDEPRGIHLSDKQLVFVFMTATVAAVVVFLFGVLVGRGAQQARGPIADGQAAGDVTQVAPDGVPSESPVADGIPRQGGGSPGRDEFSYAARLGKTPPADQLKPLPSPADNAPRDSSPPDVPGEPVPPGTAAAGPAAPAPAAASAPYTVQVAAVKQRGEADAIVKRLKTKGYDAYVFVPEGGDSLGVFRVRIGSFKDKRQADAIAERLLREEKRYKPWVTR
jgi:cell division septation protein DedD